MPIAHLLIISENNPEQKSPRTVRALAEAGYLQDFARGPLKIEELLIKKSDYIILWDLAHQTNLSLCREIAGIIRRFEIAGCLLIGSRNAFADQVRQIMDLQLHSISSFDNLSEVIAALRSPEFYTPKNLTYVKAETEASEQEMEFIGLFRKHRDLPDSDKPNPLTPPPDFFKSWRPTGGDEKSELTLHDYTRPQKSRRKLFGLF